MDEIIQSQDSEVQSKDITQSSPRQKQANKIFQNNQINPDEALKLAGDKNFYQIRLAIILCLEMTLISFLLQGQPFFFISPDFQCLNDNKFQSCNEKDFCFQRNIDSTKVLVPQIPNTIVVHFKLYCERSYILTLTEISFFFFANIAILIVTAISDSYGRRKPLLISYIVGAISVFSLSFSSNIIPFFIFFLLCGIGTQPFIACMFVLISESGNEQSKRISTLVILITFALGQLIVIPLVYYCQDWQKLLLFAVGIPMLLLIIPSVFWIFESPKFLISSNKIKKAKKVLLKIAKVNKIQLESEIFDCHEQLLQNQRALTDSDIVSRTQSLIQSQNLQNPTRKMLTFIDLFKYRSTRKTTIALSMGYLAIYVCYFGSILAIQSLGGNIYLNAIYITLAELLTYIIASLNSKKFQLLNMFLEKKLIKYSIQL